MENRIKNRVFPSDGIELPPELEPVMKQAKKYEVITVVYLVTVVLVMFLALSSSQAMKVAWLEDLISMVPSIVFLIASKFYNKPPSYIYPYGFHRVFSIGFAFGSFALLAMGLFVSIDSITALIKQEHPTIPHKEIFGYHIWFGWIMILALLYSFIPALILGKKKKPLAEKLHNKLLNVDAQTQKADWMTAAAAIVGIIGIGCGLWWADAVTALFISISILKDGYERFSDAITDFLGQIPTTVESGKLHEINTQVADFLNDQHWIEDFRMRLREEGEVFLGEVYVQPKEMEGLIENIEKCALSLKDLDWKVHEITIQPVRGFKAE